MFCFLNINLFLVVIGSQNIRKKFPDCGDRLFHVEVSAIHYADGPSLMIRLGVLPLFF